MLQRVQNSETAPVRDAFSSLTDRFLGDDLLPGFFFRTNGGSSKAWTPRVDIQETENAYRLHADLPGLTKDEIDVTFENGVLTLAGERSFEQEETKDSFRRIERGYGAFSRSFSLPREVDATEIAAGFENGVLTIEVPKAAKALAQKIKIG